MIRRKASLAARWPLRAMLEVDWEDSTSSGGWADVEAHRQWGGRLACRSIGYLVERSKDHIILAQSMACHGKITDTISIPAACVRAVRRVR